MPTRVKVAILGSGCGGMSAAYWLSANQRLREKYEVTVHTQGWRLGGKAASGRRGITVQIDGRPVTGHRIEEHGLHVMLGFYETVFHVMRDCYARRQKTADDAFASWSDAFEPLRQISPMFRWPPGGTEWRPWNIDFLRLPGEPGDEPLQLPPPAGYMRIALYRVWRMLLNGPLARLKQMSRGDAVLEKAFSAAQARPVNLALSAITGDVTDPNERDIRAQVENLQTWFRGVLTPLFASRADAASDLSFTLHGLRVLIDLGLAGLMGYLKDVYFYGEAGYERINDLDFKDWLQKHGASEESAYSPFIMLLYDLAFAYVGGDSSDPKRTASVAAGAMLRLAIRMAFTYKDAPAWRMKAGMGDAVFTPLYQVLTARGVRFHFFHRVRALHLSGGKTVESIDCDCQAKPVDGYAPLVRLPFGNGKEWECWPAEPDWSQIAGGDELKSKGIDFEDPWCTYRTEAVTLKRSQDFDIVVAAIPPLAFQPLTAELVAANAKWSAMFANTASVATHSAQLWLRQDLRGLGWPNGPTVATAYADPLRSWGEMSQVLAAEAWPANGPPRSCQYLCGTYLPTLKAPPPGTEDANYLRSQMDRARELACSWLESNTRSLWPDVATGAGLDPRQIFDQYYRANVAWSEQYVQSLPGTVQYRLAPGQSGFDNLYLAGDWTRTSINGGCAEAAFESGLSAACAISGESPPIPD